MNILIVGGGNLAYFLCRTLQAKKHRVTLIDRDYGDCEWIEQRLSVTVLHGDGTSAAMLEEGGGYQADAVIAIMPGDQDNLATCQLARLQFNVQRTVAVVNDPDNEAVFRELGVRALAMTPLLIEAVEQRAAKA